MTCAKIDKPCEKVDKAYAKKDKTCTPIKQALDKNK